MAVENFTGASWSDYGGTYVDNAANTLTVAASNTDAYSVHRVFSAGHFSGDFEHIVSVKTSLVGGTRIEAPFWGVSNKTTAAAHDMEAMEVADEDFIASWIYWSNPSDYRFYIREWVDGAAVGTDYWNGMAFDTTYYVEFERDEDTGTYGTMLARIYTDVNRTSLADTLSITLHEKIDFTTVYGCFGKDVNQSVRQYTQEIKNLDLQEAGTTHTVTGAITLPALTVSGAASKKHVHSVTGAVTLPALEVSGQAAKKHVYSATGAITLPALEVSGTATKKHVYSVTGAIELPALEVAGEAQSASGKVTHEVTGAITLPALEVSGTAAATTGKVTHEVTGAIVLPALEVSGEATRFHSWEVTGAVTLPALEVDGQAEIAISLACGGETDFQVYSSEDEDYVTGMALVDSGLLLNVDWKQRATEAECL